MSKQRCQIETTTTEFKKWMIFFREEDEREYATTRYQMVQEFYWAQIAMYICKVNAKHPENVRLDQFYYKRDQRELKKGPTTKEEASKKSRNWWRIFLGAASSITKARKKNR